MSEFVHLQVKSHYSLRSGLPTPKDIVDAAHKKGLKAVAMTDKNSFFGIIKFYNYAISKGVKPICGVDFDIESNLKGLTKGLLLAKNKKGLEKLFSLSTKSYLQANKGIKINENEILALRDDIIFILPSDNFSVYKSTDIQEGKDVIATIDALKNTFSSNLYLGVTNYSDDAYDENSSNLIKFCSEKNIHAVALNDVHFIKQSDYLNHQAKVAINTGTHLRSEMENPSCSKEQYFKTFDEMKSNHKEDLLLNTFEIAKQCNVFLSEEEYFLPSYQIEEKISLAQHLENISKQRLEEYLKENEKLDKDIYRKRLASELKIITEKDYPGYFLIVMDFVKWAKQNSIPVGPGRGSGAGSLVAFLLSITELDPLKYGLIFERFLNPERMSFPDFDIDFCIEGRDNVIDYVKNKYGEKSVAQIGTIGTMAAKGVIRDVTRILDKPYGFGDKLAKLIPDTPGISLLESIYGEVFVDKNGDVFIKGVLDEDLKGLKSDEAGNVSKDGKIIESLKNSIPKNTNYTIPTESNELKKLREEDDEAAEIIELSLALEGKARSIGKHAAGVVIAPNDIHEFTPLHFDEETDSLATQLDMYDVEESGLIKFDFLGLRTLTVINNAVKSIENIEPDFKLKSIPFDDKKVFQLLKSGKTKGIFQLESRGMVDVVKRMKPENFSDIIALVALYRPGPMESGMLDQYIKRKLGKSEVTVQHPALRKILNETYGVFVYQEQVMEAAQVLASYSLGDADNLRRAMGKKKADVMEQEKGTFVKGCEQNSIDAQKAGEIFENIETFAGYGFNKSHSAAYAYLAYQTAYLKTHFTAHFLASVLTSEQDKTDKLEPHIKDCEVMKVKIIPPNINSSKDTFLVNKDNCIEYSLAALKNVGRKFVQDLCEEREKGEFKNMMDLASRVDLRKGGKRALESMAKAGVFDDFCGRNEAISMILKVLEASDQIHSSKETGAVDMFGDVSLVDISGYEIEEFTESELLNKELECFGYYFSQHPLITIRNCISSRTKPINKLQVSGQEKFLPVLIHKKRIRQKGSQVSIWLEVSDETGNLDVSIPRELHDNKKELFKENSIVMLKGKFSHDDFREDARIRMRATDIMSIEDSRNHLTTKLCLEIDRANMKKIGNGQFPELKELESDKGVDVFIRISDEELNLSSEFKVDNFKISLEDSTFEKLNKLFGEEKYKLY